MRARGGEDVEDQLAAVEHLDALARGLSSSSLISFSRFADLRGREVVAEDDDVGLLLARELCDLHRLAAADVGGRSMRASWMTLPTTRARPARERRQFAQRVARVAVEPGRSRPRGPPAPVLRVPCVSVRPMLAPNGSKVRHLILRSRDVHDRWGRGNVTGWQGSRSLRLT